MCGLHISCHGKGRFISRQSLIRRHGASSEIMHMSVVKLLSLSILEDCYRLTLRRCRGEWVDIPLSSPRPLERGQDYGQACG